MLLNEIKHTTEYVTGVNPSTQRIVVVDKTISYIYKISTRGTQAHPEAHYEAVTWKNQLDLGLIEALFLDKPLDERGKQDLEKIVIRFGWISKDMRQLEWVPITRLHEKYLLNILTPTEKNKFNQICRTLCIPMRVMSLHRKNYVAGLAKTAKVA